MIPAPHSPAAAALELREVHRRYGKVAAATGLQLSVQPGELVTIIGPSGCGKSTLLRLIAGLERPDAGVITIAGKVAADRRRFQQPEHRQVGLVFQDHALFPNLTVAGNIAFGLQKSPAARRAARVAEVLQLVRLSHLAQRYPHELSGGEQQRVALARALAPSPAVVLLDEPFSSLDETLRARVRGDVEAVLRATGTTAILVTHDQTEALSFGDRVVVMRSGRIEQVDVPEAVFERPASRFVATFMGDADFLPARVRDGRLECELGRIPGSWPPDTPDEQLEVVLRPHEVSLAADEHGDATVVSSEYRGVFTLHHVQLGSGRTVRALQLHPVRLAPGQRVVARISHGTIPTVLRGEHAAGTFPRPTPALDAPEDARRPITTP
ncbi:ABC transporter ATP-binding protein [Glutamicibacter nicotianae]|uniref:ABC transporter ATP-binding protein n=1 Tax=Glutamicibacter nicotianae TaxID=37929 RepID=UPI00167FC8A6|nr:ABC transporter ATP-binding protein [Glutamicibacter nicotianae]